MGNSLREQLLQAGLVDKTKVNSVNKQKRKQAKQRRQAKEAVKPTSLLPEQAAKRARDRELDLRRIEARRQRELAAQVKQLVAQSRYPRKPSEDDIPFHFDNKGKVKKLYVSAEVHKMISSGRLVIVNCNGSFELVPPETAEKIRQRNPSLVIDLPEEERPSEDDPYAAYHVPDDLIW